MRKYSVSLRKCCRRRVHRSLIYSFNRWLGSIRYGVCFSQVVRFLCELSPYTAMYELNWPAISLLGGELALPIPGWPASAALIGNSDTTAKPASWQVYFRCTRGPILRKSGSNVLGQRRPQTRRRKTLQSSKRRSNGAAFWSCIATGLPNLAAGSYPPHLLQVVRRRLPFLGPLWWRWFLPGPAVLGLPIYGSRYITGTLLNSNRRAVRVVLYFHQLTMCGAARFFGI